MSDQTNLHDVSDAATLQDPSLAGQAWAQSAVGNEPLNGIGDRARPTPRFVRAALMIAIFFCGWSLFKLPQINLTVSDVVLSVVMVTMLLRGDVNARPFEKLTVFWLLGLGLMLLGLLIGSVDSGSVDRWLIVGAQYLFAFLLLPMLLMGQQNSLTRTLPALFVIGIAVSQLIGISASLLLEYSVTKEFLGPDFVTGNGRVGAMSGEPNANGAMIAFALPMLLYCLRRGIIPLGIGILCGALLVWGLLASGSFTGFCASVASVGIYIAVSGLGTFLRASVVAVIASSLYLVSGLPLPSAFEERVFAALSTGNLNQAGTFSDRSDLIAEAWQMTDDNIIVGLGVDQFRVVSSHGAPVHETHLLIWNEGGVLAFIGLLLIVLTMIVAAMVAISRNRTDGAMILAVVAVFNVYTFAIPHMYTRAWILPVLLAMSACFAVHAASNRIWRDTWQ
ncbi:MAG: hypothetical protein QNI87_09125 [Erythrobacter sp.]|uniref:O-antigen ligase family protein n=1 Tax=Erythrobacter sp. TaxID=1042 RepID=UPI00262B2929|nr:hypothetical protein [Erythrobacter sp.]MDJ0978686.1 hypothetical protein [Erythrobacter sp.]